MSGMKKECTCSFAQRLQGDACEVCNPDKTIEILREQLEASGQRLKKLEKFEQQMKTLRELCGYVEDGSNDSVTLAQEDGSNDSVTLAQEDATGTWHITVGYSPRKRKSFWDESFDGVFLKAKSYVEEM